MQNGLMQRCDFGLVIRPQHVVSLDEVDAPPGILRDDRIVVCLRSGLGHIDAVHVSVPLAEALVGDVGGMNSAAKNRDILCNCLARNSAKNVNPEPEALARSGSAPRWERKKVREGTRGDIR